MAKSKAKSKGGKSPEMVTGLEPYDEAESAAFEFEFDPDHGAFDHFFNEAVQLFHQITHTAEQIHHEGQLTAARRGILRGLSRTGPLSVPQMARARPVSRQLIQSLVNPLAEEGYVKFIENPAHKRSHLVALTEMGKQHLREHLEREANVLQGAAEVISAEELREATVTIEKLNKYFQSSAWRRRLASLDGGGERENNS